jgi:hypothetical protein
MSYANLGMQFASSYADSLKDVMLKVKQKTSKLAVVSIVQEDDVFAQFKSIYGAKSNQQKG